MKKTAETVELVLTALSIACGFAEKMLHELFSICEMFAALDACTALARAEKLWRSHYSVTDVPADRVLDVDAADIEAVRAARDAFDRLHGNGMFSVPLMVEDPLMYAMGLLCGSERDAKICADFIRWEVSRLTDVDTAS